MVCWLSLRFAMNGHARPAEGESAPLTPPDLGNNSHQENYIEPIHAIPPPATVACPHPHLLSRVRGLGSVEDGVSAQERRFNPAAAQWGYVTTEGRRGFG